MQIAIFNTNAGYLQWIGEAVTHEEAIRALDKSVGLWEISADRSDVMDVFDRESLLVKDVTEQQALALQTWADHGFKSSHYPDDLPSGVTYTSGEVLEMIEHQ